MTPPPCATNARRTSCPTTRSRSSRSCTPASTPRRLELLKARKERGAPGAFLDETKEIREGDWQVAPPRPDYEDRRVEITGPTDRKLVINALNSGAKGFMADFEDANSPTWANQVEGHVNLIDAIEGTITYDSSEGKHYELNDEVWTLLVRPRGWHLPEKHLRVDGETIAGALDGLRAVLLPQRAAAAGPRQGAVLLPTQDGSTTLKVRLRQRRLRCTPRTRSGSRRARSARRS